MNIRNLLTLLLLLAGTAVSASVESGYYYIKSYNGKYMTENTSNHTLVCSEKVTPAYYAQVWYLSVSGSNVTFKNALTDKYVQGQGSFSQQYATGNSQQTFTIGENDDTYTFQYDSYNKAGLHCDNSNVVVEWYVSEDKSKWTIEAVDVDSDALAAQKSALTEVSTSQLTQFFTNTACTELKSTYASYSDAALRTAMSGLPTTVQDMAIKVKNNTWITYSGWDKTEKTFRVADYKAYSSSSRWTSIIGLGYNFGRLTNPTGIWVSTGDFLQVYVGDIPNGQVVQLEVADEYQASGTTYALHQGMNALRMASAGSCFISYEVDNTSDGKAPYTAIDSYAPVTVHIEGGTVNGYFDLTKGYTNSDWTKLKSKLLTGNCVELKTSNLLFHMHTDLVKAACPEKMVELLGEWDKILNMEYSLMGLEAYDGYWNNMLSVTDMTGDSYMHATTYGTYYNVTTVPDVMSYESLSAGSVLWGPAHENGHVFQQYINMVGQTEVSNNVFSNVAVYNNGHLTSRAANISTTFQNMANNVFWNDRDIWERTHLYFQLYQFFHILGKKTDFYPELFKALRNDPMIHTGNTFISASDDYLKFYKKCCAVSGYDLTEFFQAYGFFVIPAMTSYTLNGVTKNAYKITDYSDYYLTVTQAEIDAAKQAVANMHLPKANIIFIEDRITAPAATYSGAAAGAKKTAYSSEYPIGAAGETGQYTTFGDVCSAYKYNVSDGGTVVMQGTGAVGFKVYDNNGTLRGIYNTYTFRLPAGLTDYTIVAAAGNGSDATATIDTSIEVEDFPKANMWYSFCSSLRGNRYVMSNGTGMGVTGQTATYPLDEIEWRFVLRDGTNDEYDIVNRADESYLDPVATYNTQIYTTATQPSAGWKIGAAATQGMYIIYSGDTQLNQTNNSGNPVYNWGGGNNISDTGCQFTITAVEAMEPEPVISDVALSELEGWTINVSTTAADNLTTGQWYVMFDRGKTNGNPHGYLYEKVASHTLYNTATVPSGTAVDACKYLVRLIDAGSGKYYIQTGYGNYFGQIEASTAVPTIATKTQRITVAKIAGTNGHFYLQGETGGVILDANDLSAGDANATVVGWGTTVPTTTGGNNDWAFYPVELIYPVTLKEVGEASYATLYLPFDVQTDADTKAYYVETVSNGYAQLTETTNSGRDIPARTAVILINNTRATNVNVTQAAELNALISEKDNMLKGTLKNMTLDLSQDLPYYSLGRMDGKIGFYKFNNNGTTSIELAANKAYLEVPQSGNVKGFALIFDTTDGISSMDNGRRTKFNATIFNLAGQRLSKPGKGVFIINGKKVIK